MNCRYCKHEAHEPGKCPHDNCGEAEVSRSGATATDSTRVVTYENFKRGEVSTTDVTHIKPRSTGNN